MEPTQNREAIIEQQYQDALAWINDRAKMAVDAQEIYVVQLRRIEALLRDAALLLRNSQPLKPGRVEMRWYKRSDTGGVYVRPYVVAKNARGGMTLKSVPWRAGSNRVKNVGGFSHLHAQTKRIVERMADLAAEREVILRKLAEAIMAGRFSDRVTDKLDATEREFEEVGAQIKANVQEYYRRLDEEASQF